MAATFLERISSLAFGLVAVAGLTLAAYSGAGALGFVTLDDPGYLTQNLTVQQGLGPDSLRYALESNVLSNWHPVTWLSHMASVEAFGMEPAGHHWVNVALHLANALVLLVLLREMTAGSRASAICSLVVAALFAVHPLHVESVAWVAERKDVLSTLFWLLATWAYVRWTRRARRSTYVLVCVLLALGLMSKAMLVTLPFTLLLLDAWPLGRWRGRAEGRLSAGQLLREKLPLFALVLVFCIVTFQVQQSTGAVGSTESFPLGLRLANAVNAIGAYLRQTVWPVGLAAFYPYPSGATPPSFYAAALALAGLSALAWFLRRCVPALAVGWLWFLGTLVPVIGLVQVGNQAHADRYTYVPHIGLFVGLVWALAWAGRQACERRKRLGFPLGAVAAVAILALVPVTRAQVARWESDATLFRHTLEVTEDNYLAHDFYGRALRADGKLGAAMEHYRAAIEIRPEFATAHLNLGVCYMDRGEWNRAVESFQTALRYRPTLTTAWANLAAVYGGMGRLDESLEASQRALAIDPDDAGAHSNAAVTCLALGKVAEALEHFRAAFALNPATRFQPLALEYAWALSTRPDAELRNGVEAERFARAYCESTGYRNVFGLEALTAALAESGRFEEALHTAEQALRALEGAGRGERAQRFRGHIETLRAGRPLRSTSRLVGG